MPIFEMQTQDGRSFQIEAKDMQSAVESMSVLEGMQKQTKPEDEWKRGVLAPIERNERTGEMRPAVPGIAMSIWDAMKLPGDTLRGDVPDLDPRSGAENMSKKTAGRVLNAATIMSPTTPASRFNMRPSIPQANKAQQAAIKRFQSGLADDQIPGPDAMQRLRMMGPDAMPMDLGPNLQQKAGALASVPGGAQKAVYNAVETRAANAGARVADDVVKAFGTGKPAAAMIDDIVEAQSKAAAPLYDAVRDTPVAVQSNLKLILDTPMGKRALGNAVRMAANDGVKANPASGSLTVGVLDYVKRSLDDVATSAMRAGRNNEARQARQLAQILTSEVDKVAPAYAKARATFAGHAAVKDALEIGTEIFSKKLHPSELASKFRTMTASEKEAMVQGARAAIEDAVGNAVNDPLMVRNLLRKGYNRDKLQIILGKDALDDLVKAMDREIAFGNTRNAVTGNSATAARQAAQAEAAPHLRPTNVPHGWFDSVLRVFDGARKKLAVRSTQEANEELAKLLTSKELPPNALAPQPGMMSGAGSVVPFIPRAIFGGHITNYGEKLKSGGGGY